VAEVPTPALWNGGKEMKSNGKRRSIPFSFVWKPLESIYEELA
jgi:hypothetical protein